MKRLIFLSLIIILFTNCKKESSSNTGQDFLPVSAGTNWTYTSSGNTFKLTVTNRDTVALGRTYNVIENSNGPNQYQAKVGNEYYRFATFQGFLPNGVEELYLKGDQNANATWQFTVNVQVGTVSIPVTAKYTIKEKGISMTVQGQAYNNVTHVRQDLSSALGNNGGGDYYYATGIGMISSNISITVPGSTTNNVTELVSYEIK